MIGKKVKFVT